jgi:hypothetical protein
MDAMDDRHLLLLATGTRTIRISDGEAEELAESVGQLQDDLRLATGTRSGAGQQKIK